MFIEFIPDTKEDLIKLHALMEHTNPDVDMLYVINFLLDGPQSVVYYNPPFIMVKAVAAELMEFSPVSINIYNSMIWGQI